MEVGQISIGGSLDSGNIEQGLTRVETGFKNVGATGKSVNSDFVRMNQQAVRLGKTMGLLSLAGAGAMVAMAKGAPAVAGAMAKIQVSMLKLKMVIGEALKPQFEWFSDKLNLLAGWVGEHPDIFRATIIGIEALAAAFIAFKIGGWISAGITTITTGVSGLIGVISSPAFAIAIVALGTAAALWAVISGQAESAKQTEAFYAAAGISHEEVVSAYTQGYQGTIYPGMTTGRVQAPPPMFVYDYTEGRFNRRNATLAWDDWQ